MNTPGKPRKPLQIAVVIPTVGRSFFVVNMVMALLAGSRRPDEIIIVDQTDEALRNPWSYAQLQQWQDAGVCRILFEKVKSLPMARNIGSRASRSDLLVFVDDDAFIPPDYLAHYEALFTDPDLDAATGMILVSERDTGTIDTSTNQPSQHDGHTMLRGGNFAIRREVMFAIGGLDESLVGAANHEDADLAARLHAAGCKVIWAPAPWLYHLSFQGGGGRIANPAAGFNFAYNLFYFHLRHGRLNSRSLRTILRRRLLNRGNLTRPWRLPRSALDLWRGYRAARRSVATAPQLPLHSDGAGA